MPKGRFEKVPVPCGRCPPCKTRRVNSWVFRLEQEHKRSTHAHFVTLTYDTRFVPISENGFMTLRKSDIQKFFKRLRKLTNDKVKYYAAGEYGSKYSRPHYHIIIFNVCDDTIYQKAWTVNNYQLGTVHIGQVTPDSMAYTMKYIDKAQFKKKHARDDREKEFALMSKGLGDNYLDIATDYHTKDITKMYCTKPGGYRIAMPKYFRDKIYNEDQKRQQRVYIQDVIDEKERIERSTYKGELPYEDYKELQKVARYNKFYNNQKIREI